MDDCGPDRSPDLLCKSDTAVLNASDDGSISILSSSFIKPAIAAVAVVVACSTLSVHTYAGKVLVNLCACMLRILLSQRITVSHNQSTRRVKRGLRTVHSPRASE